VHKADAERAIEKMQNFPIGGSRIRLSWGRSQYKAAQAAAQAAQAAAMQAVQIQLARSAPLSLTPDQVLQIIQKCSLGNLVSQTSTQDACDDPSQRRLSDDSLQNLIPGSRGNDVSGNGVLNYYAALPYASADNARHFRKTSFSPFTPDPNLYIEPSRHVPISSMAQSLRSASPVLSGGYTNSVAGVFQYTPSRPAAGLQQHFAEPVRSSSHVIISRPSSTKRSTSPSSNMFNVHDSDQMQDLNGTLASLNLDYSSHAQPGRV